MPMEGVAAGRVGEQRGGESAGWGGGSAVFFYLRTTCGYSLYEVICHEKAFFLCVKSSEGRGYALRIIFSPISE